MNIWLDLITILNSHWNYVDDGYGINNSIDYSYFHCLVSRLSIFMEDYDRLHAIVHKH